MTTTKPFIPGANTTFVEIARRRALEQPQQRAYTFLEFRPEATETHLTYQALHLSATAVAAELQALARKGERALLLYRAGLDFVSAFLGCLYAGVVAVPLAIPRHGQRGERLQRVIADAGSSIILCSASVRRAIEKLITAADTNDMKWICTDEIAEAGDASESRVDLGDLAHIQYSSGSTGQPKGVMISHANLVHQSAVLHNASGSTEASCCVSWLPFFHDMGLVAGLLQPLYGGFPGILMSPEAFVENPFRWLKALSNFRADVTAAPNFAYEMCVSKSSPALRQTLDLSCWRFAFTGAEPVRAKTVDEFSAAFAQCGFRRDAFFPAYGLAEATLMVTGGNRAEGPLEKYFSADALERNQVIASSAADHSARRLVGCGASAPGQTVLIVNPETRRTVDSSEVGEIWVSGPSVSSGYWNNAEATAETFATLASHETGTYLRTGDLGFLHEGELFICGRLKDLILIRGRNHHAPDIEFSVEGCHPALRPACAAAFPIQIDEEEQLVLVQEVDRRIKMSDSGVFDKMIAEIRRVIAEQHDLQVFAVILVRHGSIPRTSSGKIQRHECRKLYLEGRLNIKAAWVSKAEIATQCESSSENPDSSRETREWLIRQIASRLGRLPAEFRAENQIAELGLSEETMLELTRALELYLGRPLPMTMFLEHPTIQSLAEHLTLPRPRSQSEAEGLAVVSHIGEERKHEPIAIVGIGCRFPGAHGPRAFWKMLCDGVDAVTEVPLDRWDIDEVYDPNPLAAAKMNTRHGGFLKEIDRLDRKFFELSIREAVRSDPQHRLMLEVAWEALEDAGICPDRLAGSATGVFVGISASDYAQMQFGDARMTDAYAGLGCALTIAASRVSHFLNLRGPAIAVDTACSSSLSAIHLACASIRKGECTTALAGGVNVLLSPIVTMCLTKAGMMAGDGRCKAFDARANGYVRSEGAGLVVLKSLSQAIADGDPIYAVIRGSASNQDGRSSGISAPNGDAQKAVIMAACQDANVSPGELDYVEAHGTGTAVGDPIEAKALGAVLGIDRAEGAFCPIGSVKTNIGHAESAAGVASVIKVALILKHRQIPPSLHFENANFLIPFDSLPIRVQTTLEPLPVKTRPSLAGVNGFGVGGTNVHLVLEESPRREVVVEAAETAPERPFVLALSAKSQASLEAGVQTMADMLSQPELDTTLADICYSAGAHRTAMPDRLAATGNSIAEIAAALQGYLEHGQHPSVATGVVPPHLGARPKLVFAFSGQGSQWPGMGCRLVFREPIFRRVIEECDELFRPYTGWSLIDELYAETSRSRLDQTEVAQPALFAVQVGVTELLRTWGIVPDAVVGHSAGEVAAAQIAGALSLADAIHLIANRAKLMQQATGTGKMASVELSLSELEPLLVSWNDRLSIAAVNGPNSVVLSGDTDALQSLLESLASRNVVAVPLPGNYAFHSYQMEPFKTQLIQRLTRQFDPGCVQLPMFSTVTGAWCNGQLLDANYWGANVRQPVLFAQAIAGLANDGAKIFVEIGPHPVITGAISRNLKSMSLSGTAIPTLRRDEDEQRMLSLTVAKLYTQGCQPDWKALYPGSEITRCLPTYQWDRQRFWLDLPDKNLRRPKSGHPLLGDRLTSAQPAWHSKLDGQGLPFIKDFRAASLQLLPGGVLTEIALATTAELFSSSRDLVDITFHEPVELSTSDEGPTLQATASLADNGEAEIRVFSEPVTAGADAQSWPLHLTARALARDAGAGPTLRPLPLENLKKECRDEFDGPSFYRKLEAIGIHYGASLRAVEHLWRRQDAALVEIRVPEPLVAGLEKYRLHPSVLEAATQACRVAYGVKGSQIELAGFQRVHVLSAPHQSLYAYVQLRCAVESGQDLPLSDISICDADGEIVALLEGARLKLRQDHELVRVSMDPEQWLYDVTWQSVPRARKGASGFQGRGNWLIFTDGAGTGERLAELLREQRERCVLLYAGASFSRLADDAIQIRPGEQEDIRRILTEELPSWRGIIHLWAADAGTVEPITSASIARDQGAGAISILALLQGIASAVLPRAPRLWTVTRAAQLAGEDALLPGFSQSGIWGLGKVIALEHPELKCCRIDLSQSSSPEEVASLFEECWSNSREDQVALRGEERYVARLTRRELGGNIASKDHVTRRAPAEGELEVRVSAAAGPGRSGFAGKIVRLGSNVTGFQAGDEVVLLAPGAVTPYLTVPADAAALRPKTLSAEEAAANVHDFLSAVYALRDLARTAAGEHVLIRGSFEGGAAQAGIQVAKWLGATVFVAAGTDAERDSFLENGADQAFDDSSMAVASEVLRATAGKGVEAILNCGPAVSGPQYLPALGEAGCYIDLTTTTSGCSSTLNASRIKRNVSFHTVDIEALRLARPKYVHDLLQTVISHLGEGSFIPLPFLTLSASQIETASTEMPAKRIAVQFPDALDSAADLPEPVFHPDGTYLITGGLGGLGLAIAKRMVAEGARHLVLISRRPPSAAAQESLAELAKQGANTVVASVDVSDAAQVSDLLNRIHTTMPALRGIIHAAGLLENGLLVQLNETRFRSVMDSKVAGAWHLHKLTLNAELDFFVMFSSLASLIGSPGQGNYAAANAFLDGLATHRRTMGLPALSIAWGPWAEVGMAADVHNAAHLEEAGMGMLPPDKALDLLELLIRKESGVIGAIAMNWQLWSRAFPVASDAPFVSGLMPGAEERALSRAEMITFEALQQLEPATQVQRLEAAIHKAVCQSLQLEAVMLTMDVPLTAVGLDSIAGLELKNRLESAIDVVVQTPHLLGGPTVHELAGQFLNQLISANRVEVEVDEGAAPTDAETLLGELDQLSDDEISALLSTMAAEA